MPMPVAVAVLAVAALAVIVFGRRLATVVDRLADRTGIGEALAGAVLLAAATSLAGLVASVTAASGGDAQLAVSNSIGGVGAQTAFLVVADLLHRGANLEHAAASITNVFSALLMTVMLGIVVIGMATSTTSVWDVHPASLFLPLVYGYGLWLSRRVSQEPMWRATRTPQTRVETPDSTAARGSLTTMWLSFALFAVLVSAAGFAVARAGVSLAEASGLSSTFIGAFITSIVTSMPELVTTVAAVRAGALSLAVGGIVGGNAFDLLFVAASDVAYRDGGIYAAMGASDMFLVGWTILLVGTAAAGLVRREPTGIGFEGYSILAIYAAGVAVLGVLG
ncbi:sodium:calcium antiporter [Phytoactinopolyspora halotolerans]|nr:hypothetical protein [Phytoactinopolyspora halotolerans]